MKSIQSEQRAETDVFWGELAPCDHCVQIYEDDGVFLDALEGFVAAGLREDDAIILIGTQSHLEALQSRLQRNGVDLATAIASDRYIALDAQETLSRFMVNGWPDEALFEAIITSVLARARADGRKVRAFGEMVALMWAEGYCGATVQLEHMWTRLCSKEQFSLFCAYPSTGFTQDSTASLADVCAAHNKVYQR